MTTTLPRGAAAAAARALPEWVLKRARAVPRTRSIATPSAQQRARMRPPMVGARSRASRVALELRPRRRHRPRRSRASGRTRARRAPTPLPQTHQRHPQRPLQRQPPLPPRMPPRCGTTSALGASERELTIYTQHCAPSASFCKRNACSNVSVLKTPQPQAAHSRSLLLRSFRESGITYIVSARKHEMSLRYFFFAGLRCGALGTYQL